MMALTSLDYYFLTPNTRTTVVIGSFAATAVLTFAAVDSPLAQPKNVFFGHIISALVGVSMQILLGNKHQWLAAALAVSVAILLMCLTDTVHPPGGATALIAVYSDQKIRNLKFFYVLIPVASGALILFLVALLANNCFPWRKYPKYWN
uniref:HPP family protein n=1 Tax=Romanomermis culicivorax TaxID=13658 RepID=A0A915IYW8_ROMCU